MLVFITNQLIENVDINAWCSDRCLPSFCIDIKDENNEIIVKVNKRLYIRKKNKKS
jgi:hypothetical protein